jgi:hypothetical protein
MRKRWKGSKYTGQVFARWQCRIARLLCKSACLVWTRPHSMSTQRNAVDHWVCHIARLRFKPPRIFHGVRRGTVQLQPVMPGLVAGGTSVSAFDKSAARSICLGGITLRPWVSDVNPRKVSFHFSTSIMCIHSSFIVLRYMVTLN